MAVVDDDAYVLIRISSPLCCDCVLLAAHGFPHVDVAILKDGHGINEDEVYSAIYVTLTVEMALGVDI